MTKVLPTIKVSGGEYAKVAQRLKEFRENNPRGKHESAYIVTESGSVVFTVWLWRDKTDLLDLMKAGITDPETLRSSADANGTAKNSVGSKEKDFEKLESIALGRALANLGYLASGEIASLEEMQEYENYRLEKYEKQINEAESVEQLMKLFGEMNSEEKKGFTDLLSQKKKELTHAATN